MKGHHCFLNIKREFILGFLSYAVTYWHLTVGTPTYRQLISLAWYSTAGGKNVVKLEKQDIESLISNTNIFFLFLKWAYLPKPNSHVHII